MNQRGASDVLYISGKLKLKGMLLWALGDILVITNWSGKLGLECCLKRGGSKVPQMTWFIL